MAFLSPQPVQVKVPTSGRPRVAVTCGRALSEQDREYVSKVRARLLRAASRRYRAHHSEPRGYERPRDTGDEDFRAAMAHFNAGRYASSVPHFQSAVEAAGPHGGRVALWLAQALDAAGDREEAISQLEILRVHHDPDVAATAADLLFIMMAPRLELSRDSFVQMPAFDAKHTRLVTVGLDRVQEREKPPEKYSLEWYMNQQPRTEEIQGADPAWIFAAGVVAGSAAFLLGSLK